ncbi:hypothetical protein P7C70_g2433, partial [Phenoliferia sp. Uapishka_3]
MPPRSRASVATASPKTTPPPSPSKQQLAPPLQTSPPTWYLRRLIRLLGGGVLLFWLYPMLFPKQQSQTRTDLANWESILPQFEPIQVDELRRAAVLDAFKHSYGAYEKDAFGFDDVCAPSQPTHGSTTSRQKLIVFSFVVVPPNISSWIKYEPERSGGIVSRMQLTLVEAVAKGELTLHASSFLVDSLDSLLVMGLTEEFNRAREWVKDLSFDIDDKFHNFEITIRVLGGLLSAYHLSGNDPIFLEKAIDLADRLMPVFDTPSGLPLSFVNLAQRKGIPDADNRGLTSVAEAATLQLELKYLSELTGNPIYWQKAERIVMYFRDVVPAKRTNREWYINSRARAAPNPPIDARNILRPETVESLFVAYRITGDPLYREWGWEIFQAFNKHCRLPEGGFASILDVDQVPVVHEDRMETFWISETLKYLYLLFSEDTLVPLDRFVFNTEVRMNDDSPAHILPVFTPSVVTV